MTIIVKSFFVLTKNVNVSTFNNTNFKNNFKKNIKNIDQTKITIIFQKIKFLKFKKLKLYKNFSKKNIIDNLKKLKFVLFKVLIIF